MSPALVASRTSTVPDDGAGPSGGNATFFGAGEPESGVNAQVTGLASGFVRFGIGARPPGSATGELGDMTVGVGDASVAWPPGEIPGRGFTSGSRRKPGEPQARNASAIRMTTTTDPLTSTTAAGDALFRGTRAPPRGRSG